MPSLEPNETATSVTYKPADNQSLSARIEQDLRAALASLKISAELLRNNHAIGAATRTQFLKVVSAEQARLERVLRQQYAAASAAN